MKELRAQMVFNHSCCRVVFIAHIVVHVLLWYLYEHYVRDTVPDFEATKLEYRPIVC